MTDRSAITIRIARPADDEDVRRLADLDSRRVPAGPALLALADDEPAAALSLVDGAVVADPFQPTEGLVALLRERAGAAGGPSRFRPRRAPRFRPRIAV
jgi:hypothetical protein